MQDRRGTYPPRVPQDPVEDGLTTREAQLAERERRADAGPADPGLRAELARERDELAEQRDAAADARAGEALLRRQRATDRDVAAVQRDRRIREAHDDADPGFPSMFLSARDADASAGDRAASLSDERAARQDRDRAREDRQHAARQRDIAADEAASAADRADREAADLRDGVETRTLIGQAQGLLMARHGISADEAFERLVRESQSRNVEVREVARLLVQDAGRD